MSDEKVASVLQDDDIPADQRVSLLLPMLWLSQERGLPANLCIQSCLTLRRAYGQLGIRAELRAVELVTHERYGHQIRLSGPEPSWQGPTSRDTAFCGCPKPVGSSIRPCSNSPMLP